MGRAIITRGKQELLQPDLTRVRNTFAMPAVASGSVGHLFPRPTSLRFA